MTNRFIRSIKPAFDTSNVAFEYLRAQLEALDPGIVGIVGSSFEYTR